MSQAVQSKIFYNRIFAAILQYYGYNPKNMWKRNGVYGCGHSGMYFYPDEPTFSKWEKVSRYVGGKYERESVEVFFKVSVDAKGIEWTKVS
ncbi:hypothetical protein [Helicobacter cinaedi]|uniref:hypothetical protein n=1 Tax=Helicobacter cinaedi TaxID=213 RepID=UPI000DA16243|nr:hypothetical protein [Helicobacter cinaedi]